MKFNRIHWPLPARGTKAACFGIVRFSTIRGHACSSAIRLCFYLFKRLKSDVYRRSQDPFASQKSLYFQACFQGPKSQKSGSQGIQKTTKSTPKSIKNDFREKSIFATHSTRQPRFSSPKRWNFNSKIDSKMTWKQARTKKISLKFLELKKLIYTGPQITPKSNKIL